MPDLKTLLQLGRVPNVFTAVSNVLAGYLLTHADLADGAAVALLVGSSALLYTAGMVLNDVFDVAQDTEQRPQRPIPSGRISLAAARGIGWTLLFGGVTAAALVGVLRQTTTPTLVAALLAAAVVLYDGPLKRTPLAPWMMGFCRTLNVLLGMSLGLGLTEMPFASQLMHWNPMHLWVAAGVGVYVTGLTLFARKEAEAESGRLRLIAGLLVMLVGVAWLGYFPHLANKNLPEDVTPLKAITGDWKWPMLWLLFGFFTLRRALPAVVNPTPTLVQYAVKQSIFAIVIFDAALVAAVHGPVPYAIGIAALLLPMQLVGAYVYST